jgi:hypothetical protein
LNAFDDGFAYAHPQDPPPCPSSWAAVRDAMEAGRRASLPGGGRWRGAELRAFGIFRLLTRGGPCGMMAML